MSVQNPKLSVTERQTYMDILRNLPTQLEAVVEASTPHQLSTAYLSGEWSVNQIIHHLADAHMNSYIRTKRILAEDSPEQRPFNQESWVDMADEADMSVDVSLMILKGVHIRWVKLFESLTEADWQKTGRFRSDGSDMTIDYLLHSYASHSQVHLTQIEQVLAAQVD
ncbi:MAG: DinB family protein [Chloroflexota bacterium]